MHQLLDKKKLNTATDVAMIALFLFFYFESNDITPFHKRHLHTPDLLCRSFLSSTINMYTSDLMGFTFISCLQQYILPLHKNCLLKSQTDYITSLHKEC